MIKRFYYKYDDGHEREPFDILDDSLTSDSATSSSIVVNRETGKVLDGRKRLLKLRKQVSEEKVKDILNHSRYSKDYSENFLFGTAEKSASNAFRNDPYLTLDFGKLKNIHKKLMDEGELKRDSDFYSWIHSHYQDPMSKFYWISKETDWLKEGDGGVKMPILRPHASSLLLNLKTLFKIKTDPLIKNLKISIIPMAQDKLLVLTIMPPSTHFTFHAKQIESEYIDVLERIFNNNIKESKTDNNSIWDFIGTNNNETISLKFEFKFVSSEDFTKKDKFQSISRKRLERTGKMILSFRNFFSQHNKRHYEFSREDFKEIDKYLTRYLIQFRKEYEKYFEKLDKSKKVEKDLEKNLRDLKRKNIHNERFILETEERLKENTNRHQYELKKMNDKINQLNEMLVKVIKEK